MTEKQSYNCPQCGSIPYPKPYDESPENLYYRCIETNRTGCEGVIVVNKAAVVQERIAEDC